MFIDQHCHIEDENIIKEAFSSNIIGILNAGNDLDEMDNQLKLTQKYNNVWTSAGIHPDLAHQKLAYITPQTIIEKTTHPKVIAIGECGLDYYYGGDYKKEQQTTPVSASRPLTTLLSVPSHKEIQTTCITHRL